MTKNEDARVVSVVPQKDKGAKVGRPRKIMLGAMRSKVAYPQINGISMGMGGNFYSPELSTDFLELPQSIDEKRNYFRFFYETDPFVGQAIDLHTEIPLSKIRLGMPKAKDRATAEKCLRFCQRWAKRIGLLHRLLEIVHDYHLLGEVWVFAEDTSPDVPQDITHEQTFTLNSDSTITENWIERPDAKERLMAWTLKNYKGWTALRVLPPEQIHMEAFPFTDERLVELIPDSKTREIINRSLQGDKHAIRIVESMPEDVVAAIQNGGNIPLNTDPDEGSFVLYMANKKSGYEPRGHSILERCILPGTPVTIFRDGHTIQVPVETVKSTDRVLTHKGRFQPVECGTRDVCENITELYLHGRSKTPVRLTSDHKVLRVTSEGKEEWTPAGEIQPWDRIRETHVLPKPSPARLVNLQRFWRMSHTRKSPGGVAYSKNPPAPGSNLYNVAVTPQTSEFTIDCHLSYLLGVWMALGKVFTPTPARPFDFRVVWRLPKSGTGTERLVDALVSCFGPHSFLHHVTRDGVPTYTILDGMLARWFQETCYSNGSKSVPQWVFDLKERDLLSFFSGLLDGEGKVDLLGNPKLELCTRQPALASQIYLLLKRLHIDVDRKTKHKEFRTHKAYVAKNARYSAKPKVYTFGPLTTFKFYVTHLASIARLSSDSAWASLTAQWLPVEKSLRRRDKDDRWTIRRVQRVKSVPYQGPVYSFNVKTDESLTAGGLVVHNCLRTLVYSDKLRQAQTSIASRHMTPIRVVYALDMNEEDTDALREQVDMALQDPDYSIVTNFEITWNEMGAEQRLLDLSNERESIDKQLYAGLGVTESLLSGESSYSGDRINLEVINSRYMLLREILQEIVEDKIFKPMCRRMGFVELDEDGNEEVIYPTLTFTRLALRDNSDTFDALFNLYQKGSLDIDVILDLLNIDPVTTAEKLKRDVFTLNDAMMNELLRGIYQGAAQEFVTNSDVMGRISKNLGLKYTKPAEGGDEGGGGMGRYANQIKHPKGKHAPKYSTPGPASLLRSPIPTKG